MSDLRWQMKLSDNASIQEKLRRIIILRDVYDLSWRAIGEIVGLSFVCCREYYLMFERGEMPGNPVGRPRKQVCMCGHEENTHSKKRAMWIGE